jgi:isocitrate dehydrogenase
MNSFTPVTVAYGDGIGPEIMESVVRVLKEAEAPVRLESVEIGEKLYQKQFSAGISEESWNSIDRTKILLKSPTTTPQGGGYKSLNVTLRKNLGLYANVRPCRAYSPFIHSKHPNLNLVIVRENEEDLYTGIEYRQTLNSYESMKLITREGCEKIIDFAFNYAGENGRKKLTCMSKDNIMKFTDGVFHSSFDKISHNYPDIESEHYIVDIGAAKLAAHPENFDVVVTSNLYGDIISDIAAEISGSVGLAGSANIGDQHAMFEAVHGSAPAIAGRDKANPSGLMNAAIMMLIHINQPGLAATIQDALFKTIEDGIHTPDIYNEESSSKLVGTKEFTDAIIQRLGQSPKTLPAADFADKANSSKDNNRASVVSSSEEPENSTPPLKDLIGVDIFFDWRDDNIEDLAEKLNDLSGNFYLSSIASKGMKIWPRNAASERVGGCDHVRARFKASEEESFRHGDIIELTEKINKKGIDFIKINNLYSFEGDKGFSED